jgi:hypothetical protein
MKAKQQQAAGSENSPKFAEGVYNIHARNVNDRVKGDDTRPSLVGDIQRHNIALPEFHARSQATRTLHHLCRDVDTTNLDTMFMKVTGNMTGAATHIAGCAKITNTLRKTVEKLSVKGLVLQLIGDASDVFVRNTIVAGLRIHVADPCNML